MTENHKIPVGSWVRAKNSCGIRYVTSDVSEHHFEDDGTVSGQPASASCHYKDYEIIPISEMASRASLKDYKDTPMQNTYYPKIEVIRNEDRMVLATVLRKEHEGKWYLWNFVKRFAKISPEQYSVQEEIDLFHHEVYAAIIFGKVNTSLVFDDGRSVFEEDRNQISEADRIKDILHY